MSTQQYLNTLNNRVSHVLGMYINGSVPRKLVISRNASTSYIFHYACSQTDGT